jgi:hypothetical protein
MLSIFSSSLVLLLTGQALAGVLSERASCSKVANVEHTFYGYPDNDPPGPATAHNCGGRNYKAGGTGTFSDPVTMATAPGEFNVCETVSLLGLKIALLVLRARC